VLCRTVLGRSVLQQSDVRSFISFYALPKSPGDLPNPLLPLRQLYLRVTNFRVIGCCWQPH